MNSVDETKGSIYPAVLVFIAVLVLLVGLNLWTLTTVPECCDQIDNVGFPIRFFESGGIAGNTRFFPMALILDAAISLIAAGIAAFVTTRISRPNEDSASATS